MQNFESTSLYLYGGANPKLGSIHKSSNISNLWESWHCLWFVAIIKIRAKRDFRFYTTKFILWFLYHSPFTMTVIYKDGPRTRLWSGGLFAGSEHSASPWLTSLHPTGVLLARGCSSGLYLLCQGGTWGSSWIYDNYHFINSQMQW